MKYEVRKGGRVYMSTQHPACRYPPAVEASIQEAGYDIFVDGKRKKKAQPVKAGRGGLAG